MAIAEQFAGLQMDQLIGAPLRAAADASLQLANSTADFINKVGFDNGGKVRTVAFAYQKRSTNDDGTSNLDEMKVDVPMLAIVPIPNLQVDEVNILFDMEVKQSERQESNTDLSASVTGTMNFGIVKVSVTGSVSSHQSNTRSSDNSAKYHVDVRATNHGIPEGLARVLDMMAANVAPALVGSTLKDGNGQDLSEAAKERAQRLKDLRQEISQIETRRNAAIDSLENHIGRLKKLASAQQNALQTAMMQEMNKLDKDSEVATTYSQNMDKVNQSWNNLQNQAADIIRMITDSGEKPGGVSVLFALKELDSKKEVVDYDSKQSGYSGIAQAQNSAVNAQTSLDQIEEEYAKKKSEYSDAISGKSTTAPATSGQNQNQNQPQNPGQQ
ncbi:MAG: DUF2589 domain-containing protein [Acetatifactor sp.]|nr:DUF2589 domain-containing protein [Acetatifactor sp.]